MVQAEEKKFNNLRYLVFYPVGFNKDKRYPLFFHLHGAGARGKDFKIFYTTTMIKLLLNEEIELNKAIAVFPLCENDTWFDNFNDVLGLVEELTKLDYIDKSKVIGSGKSMGGYGIYQTMMSKPELFTKGLVLCAGAMYWNAARLKDIELKIFHGEKDTVIYPEESVKMYNKLKQCGANVELTLYPECDHNCWDKVYQNKDIWKWVIK